MPQLVATYHTSFCALVGVAVLWMIQALAVDWYGIRTRHIPGTPVSGGHSSVVFRVFRAHGNTTENLTAFVLCALLAMLLGGPAAWVDGLTVAFFAGRLGHMLCYYADIRLPRSVFFGIGLAATGGLALCAALRL
jgi:uncharacterized MAPEG superfamily protein